MTNKKILIITFLIALTTLSAGNYNSYEEGITYYNKGLYQQCINTFETYLNSGEANDEDKPSVLFFLGKSYKYINNPFHSNRYFSILIKKYPFSPLREQAYYNLGLNAFEQEDYKNSRIYFTGLIEEFPESEFSGSAQYWIGESFTLEKDYTAAISFFENAISNRPKNKYLDYSIYSLASVYENLKDYKKAVTYYDELISYHRNSPLLSAAQVRIGYCYFRLKEYDASILELSNPNIGTMSPEKQAEALYLLANSMYKTRDYEGAYKIYTDIQKKFPSVSFIRELRYAYAWTNFQLKKFPDAFKYFNSVSEVDDSLGIESHFWKAEAKRYSGDQPEALKIFEEFLQKYPRSSKVQGVKFQIGLISYSEQKYEQAVKFLLSTVNGRDKNISIKSYILLGEIEIYRKQYMLAESYFKSVELFEFSDNSLKLRAILGRALALFHQEKYKEALQFLTELENNDPNFEFEKVSFFIAETNFNLGKYKEASTAYAKLNISDKNYGSFALYGRAYSAYNLADYKSASYYFADYIKAFPNDERATDASLRLGDCYFAIKDYDNAVKTYKLLLTVKNSAIKKDYINYQLALTYYRSGKTKESLAELNNLSALYAGSIYGENAVYLSGWIHFQQANYNAAIDKYISLLYTMPRSRLVPLVLYSVGDAYFNLGQYDSAVTFYNRILTDHAGSPYVFDAINGIQYSYVAKGDIAGAVQVIDIYGKRDKSKAYADELFLKKGELYYSSGDYTNAISAYNEFMDEFPASPLVADALFWIGKSYRSLNRMIEARQTFRALSSRFPSSDMTISAVIELVSMYSVEKAEGEGLKSVNEIINNFKGNSRYPELLYTKGRLLLALNDQASAYDIFDETSIYYADNLFGDKAKIELGKLELVYKRYKKAVDVLQKVVSKRTDDLAAEGQYVIGLCYQSEGKNTEAITAFVRVTNVYSLYDDWVTKSYLRLGEVYEKMGDKTKAREMYKNVIAKHPSDDYGKEANAKLKRLK